MIRAIFFDLDGTLISGTTGVCSPGVRQALQTLREKGILLFAATGRAPYELKVTGMIRQLPFDGVVTLNGQYCYTPDRTVYIRPFDKEDLGRILEQIEKEPFPCMLIEKEDMYINYIDEHVEKVQRLIHTPMPPVRDFANALEREVLMIMPYISEEKTDRLVRPALRNSHITRWNAYCMDIVPKGVSKRTGIGKLLESFHLGWEEVMAFGDGDNDYDMLQSAKYGIAMANASPGLLAGGFPVTGHVDEDGVVTALKEYGLL